MEKFQKLMKSNKKKLTKEQIYEEILKDDEDFDTNNTQSRNQSKVNDEPTGETKEEQTYDKDQTTMNNNQTSPKKEKVEEQKIQNSSPKKEEKKFLTRDEVNEKVQQRKGELENTVKDFMIKAKDNEKKLKEESEKDPENKEKEAAYKDEENKNRQKIEQMEANNKKELEEYEAKLLKENNIQ